MYNAFPNNEIKNDFDYANFHYYSSFDPSLPVPGKPDFPTFNQKWQIEQAIMAAHGDGNKPIWVTEVGWTNSNPQLQSQAMQYVFDQARLSTIIQKVFWYSINWDSAYDINPGDLTAGLPPQPAFYTYQNYVQQYPLWSAATSAPPVTPTPVPATLIVSPTSFNANTDCSPTANQGWICTATLSSDTQVQSNLNWTVAGTGISGIKFTPSGGAILPGQTVQVRIALPSTSCPASANFSFTGSVNTVTVPWSC